MNEAEAYRALRLAVTAGLEEIDSSYAAQRAAVETAIAEARSGEERSEHERKLVRLDQAHEVARARVLSEAASEGGRRKKRIRLEVALGAIAVLAISGTGVYLIAGNRPPPAPQIMSAEAQAGGTAVVTWQIDDHRPIKSFTLFRRHGDTEEVTFPIKDAKQRTFEDSGLEAGSTYEYEVSAANDLKQSARSKAMRVTTAEAPPRERHLALVQPVMGNGERSLRVKWVAQKDDGAAVRLERSDNAGAQWRTVANFAASLDTGEYVDTALPPDGEYLYRTVAARGADETISSIEKAHTLPEAPTGLKAQAGPENSVRVTWTSTLKPDYKMLVRTASAERELSADEIQRREYIDTKVESGSSRQYALRIQTPEGQYSGFSQTTIIMPPNAPVGVRIAGWGPDQCEVQWERTLAGVKSFEVFRADGGAEYRSVAKVPGSEARFVDKSVKRGQSYAYKVAALNAGGSSELSAATEPISTVMPKPEAPRISARPGTAPASIQITWNLSAKDLGGIKKLVLERGNSGDGPFAPIKDVPAPLQEQGIVMDDQGLAEGTEYFYRAVAYVQDYDSPFTSPLESVVVKKQDVIRPATKTPKPVKARVTPRPSIIFAPVPPR